MSNEPVGSFKTGNTTWQVRVNHQHRFVATAPGFSEATGDSWEAMENSAKVMASKAKLKVSVPYVHLTWKGMRGTASHQPAMVKRTATGLHAGSGNVLYADGKGTGQETHSYGSSRGSFMKPFSPEDETEYLRLITQQYELEQQISKLEGKYRFGVGGLKQAVTDAINAEHAKRAGGSDE